MINFPNTPATGDLFYSQSNGVTYRWNGTLWLTEPSLGTGFGPSGDFCATLGWPATNVGATFTAVALPVISGNAGGWYNATTGRYTPPPGRYHLHADVSGNSSTATLGNLGVRIVKNGVNVQDNYGMTGYAYYAAPGVDAVLDANGTDWFEAQFNCNPTSTVMESMTFLAYPIAGAKGPPGDQGPAPTAGGGIVKDVLLASPASQIDLSNLGVKSCLILFKLAPASGTAIGINFQQTVNGTPDASNNQYLMNLYQTGATVAGNQASPLTYWQLTSVDTTYWLTGQITVPDIANNYGQKVGQYATVSSGTLYNFNNQFFMSAALPGCNGFRFFPASGNFRAGSFARVIGWP